MRSQITTALCVSSVCLVLAAPALGDTFRATRTDDPAPDACAPGDCSLREAIVAANQHPGRDKVVLGGGKTYRLSVPPNLDDFDVDGDLNLTESVKLVSSNRRLATIDGQGIDDVIHSGDVPGVSATLDHLRITGGLGAIELVGGSLSITDSEISRNDSPIAGGGIVSQAGTSLRVASSSVYLNQAKGDGGGLDVNGRATLVDSTVARNTATGAGGGIFGGGDVTLNAVTVAYNRSDEDANAMGNGGGIWVDPAATSFRVENSLVARNTAGAAAGPDCASSINQFLSGGHNLIGSTDDCTGFGPPAHGDIVNPPAAKIRTGHLVDNGGPTRTIALRHGSKAIDHAGAGAPGRDQRGVKRDRHPDIGAFERR